MSLGFPLSLAAMLSQLTDQPFGIPFIPSTLQLTLECIHKIKATLFLDHVTQVAEFIHELLHANRVGKPLMVGHSK
jgi:hypothetical protein